MRADFDEALVVTEQSDPFILEIDEALIQLAIMDPPKVSIFEMTYFGGPSAAEVSEVLGISETTVKRELRLARAWLKNKLNSGVDSSGNPTNGSE